MAAPDHELPAPSGVLPADGLSLARAKSQWLTGDWAALTAIDDATLAAHPQRDRVALLVACAHLQRGEPAQARRFARQALTWGCSSQLMAHLMISGVHNTLGRIAALKGDDAAVQAQFRLAFEITGDRDSQTAMHGRAVREMAALGLLPQAAQLLQAEFDSIDQHVQRPALAAARVEMLRSELELLQHELSLAQQRGRDFVARPGLAGVIDGSAAGTVEDRDTRLRQLSTSQLGQDLWVLERSGYKRGGFFVEFGATDGVRLSNSYLLETEFGWQGICAEPNPRMFAQLQRNRRCQLSDACIGPRSGETVEFVLAEEYGGLVKDMAADMHAAKRSAYLADAANCRSFVTVSLHDLLLRLGAPRDIDYLSIDTEGSEFEILSTFPLQHWNVRMLTVEHNFAPAREQIRQLLAGHGYERIEARWDDWYWKHT